MAGKGQQRRSVAGVVSRVIHLVDHRPARMVVKRQLQLSELVSSAVTPRLTPQFLPLRSNRWYANMESQGTSSQSLSE